MEKFNFHVKMLSQLNCKMFLETNNTPFLWRSECVSEYCKIIFHVGVRASTHQKSYVCILLTQVFYC